MGGLCSQLTVFTQTGIQFQHVPYHYNMLNTTSFGEVIWPLQCHSRFYTFVISQGIQGILQIV